MDKTDATLIGVILGTLMLWNIVQVYEFKVLQSQVKELQQITKELKDEREF